MVKIENKINTNNKMSTAGLKIWMWHKILACNCLNSVSDVMSGASEALTESGETDKGLTPI